MWALFTFLAIISFVVIHEAGHFLAAKATGMKVTEFFVGFGPRIWSFRRGETEYGFKWFILGGYVKVVGMNALEEVDPADLGRTYREKEFWKKSLVVLSGVAMNFLLAYLMFLGITMWQGEREPLPVVGAVVEENAGELTPAFQAGLTDGDHILAIDGQATESWEEVAVVLSDRPNQEVVLTLGREDTQIEVATTLSSRTEADGTETGFLGIAPETERVAVGLFTAIGHSGRQVGQSITYSLEALGNMVRPQNISTLARGLVGEEVPNEIRPVSPIGMAQIGSQVNEIGIASLLYLLATVNIILGVLNVLPLYPLDGGHFAVALYEKVSKRRADVRKLAYMAYAVIGFVLFLSLVAIISDISNPIRL